MTILYRAFRRGWQRASADVRWYTFSLSVAIVGLLLQILWSAAREAGLGTLFVMISLITGGIRLIISRLDSLVAATSVARQDEELASDRGPVAAALWREQFEQHKNRIGAIRDGQLTLRNQDEAVRHVSLMVSHASRSLLAVDLTDIQQWLHNRRLFAYLGSQLARVRSGDITLERIRFVSREEVRDCGRRRSLKRFIEMHETHGSVMFVI